MLRFISNLFFTCIFILQGIAIHRFFDWHAFSYRLMRSSITTLSVYHLRAGFDFEYPSIEGRSALNSRTAKFLFVGQFPEWRILLRAAQAAVEMIGRLWSISPHTISGARDHWCRVGAFPDWNGQFPTNP